MVNFLNLPPEIINYILYDLTPKDLIKCQLSSKFLNNTIRGSVVLQHKLALTRAHADDSPLSNNLLVDKIKALESIEDAWTTMCSDFSRKIRVPLRQSGVYDLSGGVYLLSDTDRMSLGYARLPVKENDEMPWTIHRVGKTIIDVGLSVYEHDLMVILTSNVRTDAGAANTYDIELDFIEISTRKPHPLAQHHQLFVMNSHVERPSVGIEIVGKHLVLVLSFNTAVHPQDRIYIYDWKTGTIVANFEARSHTYSGIIFLDENCFVLPNTRGNSLDVFRIPDAPTLRVLRPVLILMLPPLIDGRILGFATCRAEPNPIAEESYPAMRARAANRADANRIDLHPSRGFLLKSATALCMFELRVHVLEFNIMPGAGLQMGFPFRYSFSFVVQRNALLALVEQHALKISEQVPLEIASAGPTHIPSMAGPPLPTIPYNAWGPSVCAWFGGNGNDISPIWITTSAGRRCVRMPVENEASPDNRRFFVYEFGGVHNADKGKGKAVDIGGGNNSKPKRPTARSIEQADRLVDLEWAAQRERRRRAQLEDENGAGSNEPVEENPPSDSAYTNWAHEQAFAFDMPEDDDVEDDEVPDEEGVHHIGPLTFMHAHAEVLADHAHEHHSGEDALADAHEPQFGDDDDHDHHEHDHDHDHEQDDEGDEYGHAPVVHLIDLLSHGDVALNDDDDDDDGDQTHENNEPQFEDESWAEDPLPAADEDVIVVGGGRVLDCPEVFREPIPHDLPYIVRASRERYPWQGVLLDEERVIGVYATERGHVDTIEVVHFG